MLIIESLQLGDPLLQPTTSKKGLLKYGREILMRSLLVYLIVSSCMHYTLLETFFA